MTNPPTGAKILATGEQPLNQTGVCPDCENKG